MNIQDIYFCKLISAAVHGDTSGVKPVEEPDWTYLVRLAKRHNLLSIFMEEAVKYPSYTARHEYVTEMNQDLSVVSAQAGRTAAFLELYRQFLDAGLKPLVMKGLVCRQLYGRLCDHRPSGDEDILVKPDDYKRARDVFAANGYDTDMEHVTAGRLKKVQEISFTNRENGLHIELHFNPMGREDDVRSRMSDFFLNAFDDPAMIQVDGVPVLTMSHQKHLLFLVLHAFKHFLAGGFGLRQVLDILLYLERYADQIDEDLTRSRLRELKADIFFDDILRTGNEYLGFEFAIPGSDGFAGDLFEDIISGGVFGNDTDAARTAGRAVTFATGGYLTKKNSNSLAMIWRMVFPKIPYLLHQAPYLEQRPYLLPVAWIRRWGRFLRRNRENGGNLAFESLEISRKRRALLHKYGIL